MSKTETKARAGEGMSPVGEVKTAVAGFISELSEFRADIHNRLKQQEERLTMLDRKSHTVTRPALARSAEIEVPHQKAFNAYVQILSV